MQQISELLMPALAEFGLSEEYDRRRAQHRVERQEDEAADEDGVDGRTVDHLSQDREQTRVDEREERQLGGGEGAGHLVLAEENATAEHTEHQAQAEDHGQIGHQGCAHEDAASKEHEGVEWHGSSLAGDACKKLSRNALAIAHVMRNQAVDHLGRQFLGPL